MNHYIQQLYDALVAADEVTYDTISFLEPHLNGPASQIIDQLGQGAPEPDPVADYETIQEVREIVSDLFYKLWFESNTLTDEQVLSLQTTIRDGKKQTGRAESEPLVFYKKDRNTLENREDLQGEEFENICQDIFDNELPNDIIPDKFEIYEPPEESTNSPEEFIEVNTYWNLKRYIMQYTNGPISYDIVIAEELIKYRDDLLPPETDDTDTQENF